jgi:hypothetical protein
MLSKMRNWKFRLKLGGKGQSFVELAIVVSILLLLLSGMVEFGNLLNQYVNLVDGAREGARFGSNLDPFDHADPTYGTLRTAFFTDIDLVIEGAGTALNAGALAPILLDPARDDVLISFVGVAGGGTIFRRWPASEGAWSKYGNHTTQLSDSEIQANFSSAAPNSGAVIVEIFYSYDQLLKMPFFTVVVPDPIPVHTYVIMPLSAAEPTPTP